MRKKDEHKLIVSFFRQIADDEIDFFSKKKDLRKLTTTSEKLKIYLIL
jgi:hypothetical protein